MHKQPLSTTCACVSISHFDQLINTTFVQILVLLTESEQFKHISALLLGTMCYIYREELRTKQSQMIKFGNNVFQLQRGTWNKTVLND